MALIPGVLVLISWTIRVTNIKSIKNKTSIMITREIGVHLAGEADLPLLSQQIKEQKINQ